MKRTKLQLKRSTVRTLDPGELRSPAGGALTRVTYYGPGCNLPTVACVSMACPR